MANPTTAKPTSVFAEKVVTAGTVGELTRCQVPLLAAGVPRDPFSGLLAVPSVSRNGGGTGHPPALDATGFTAGAVTGDPCYKFTAGTMSLRVNGVGWGSTPTNPRTIWAVIKPLTAKGPTTRNIHVLYNGMDSSPTCHGWGYQVSTAGVITLGSFNGNTFTSAGITLTSGKWYLISLTFITTTSVGWNVYCYTDQAYVTNAVTWTTTAPAAYPAPTQADLIFNPMAVYDSYQNIGFYGSCYTFGCTDSTFNPATNAFFAALVADPLVACRGTYAGGGALAAGGVVNWDATNRWIDIHSNRPTGGTPASYQYRLHRSLVPDFTPDSTTRITSLQASPKLRDTTAVQGVNYWYKVEQTDGTTTVYSTTKTLDGLHAPGRLSRGDFFFAVYGDSRYAATGLFSSVNICWLLRALGYRTGCISPTLSGTAIHSATASGSWQPNTTQDPINGQASTTLLENAEAIADIAEVNYVLGELGVNDCKASVAVATTIAYYQIILNRVISQGRTVILTKPYQSTDTSEAVTKLISDYATALEALENGVTIRVTSDRNFDLGMTGIASLNEDLLHYSFSNLEGLAAGMAIFEGVLEPRLLTDSMDTLLAVKDSTDAILDAAVTSGVLLDPSYDLYSADINFLADASHGQDEFTVSWLKNGILVTSGITVPAIRVIKRADGTDLIAAGTAMTQIGATGSYYHNESTNRLTKGEAAIAIVSATIDGSTRSFARVVGRG